MIMACVLLISLSPSGKEDADDIEPLSEDQPLSTEADAVAEVKVKVSKLVPVALALGAGVIFTIQSVVFSHDNKYKINPLQLNLDGFAIYGLCVFPFYINHSISEVPLTLRVTLLSSLQFMLILIGVTALTRAFKYAKGGPVQAVEATKTLWQTVLVMVIDKHVPTLFEIAGCLTGLAGVILIVLCRDRVKNEKS